MMGDHSATRAPKASAIYGTIFISLLVLVGGVLFVGAGTAYASYSDSTTASGPGDSTIDSPEYQPVAAEIGTISTDGSATASTDVTADTTVPLEEEVDANDSIQITGSDAEVNVLTAQIGDVESPRNPKDVVMIPEQSFALHTFWGSYYPSSHTPEFIAEQQGVFTSSTGKELNEKSFTAIGDWLGIDSVISGPFPYQCQLDEGGWFSDDEHWCGWRDTSGWFSGSEPASATMYHLDTKKSLSIIRGWDYDLDNWRYDTMIRRGGYDGDWVFLDRGWGEYWKEVDHFQDDEIYDNPEASHLENTNIPLEDLYYINYNFGSDTWAFDKNQKHAWIRMEYDSLLADVTNNGPLDPYAGRFTALENTVGILNGAAGDQVAIIPNGEVTNSLEASFVDADLDLDDLDNADKLLNNHEFFNSTDAEYGLDEAQADLDELRTDIQPGDYAEYNVWNMGSEEGGFQKAIDEMETINETERQSDKHIVIISAGQEPLRPQDEWYENLYDGFIDGVPDFMDDWFPDKINEERPDRNNVGPKMDDHVVELAEQARENNISVHTLGLGSGHDGFRLASIADAASDESNCLDDPTAEDCNYVPVTEGTDISNALLHQLFDDTSLKYDVDRPVTNLSIAINGQETHQLDLGNVNDPEEFGIDIGYEPLSTTVEDLTYQDELTFQAEVNDCEESSESLEEIFRITNDFNAVYQHHKCADGDTLGTTDKNFVFTHGDDLEELSYTQVAQWTEDPAEVLEEKYPQFVDDGKLDLENDDEGTTGAIVMVPVDVNPKGYILLHVEYNKLGDATHFKVGDVTVENENHVAYEDASGDTETVVHAAGEPLELDYTVTNVAQGGEELVTLETDSGDVLAHQRIELGTNQDHEGTFEWTPTESAIGYHGNLTVSSQNDARDSDVLVEIKEPGTDLQFGPVKPNDRVYVDLTGEDAVADEIPTDDSPITFEAKINNRGPNKGVDEYVTLDVAEGASKFTTTTVDEIGAWGWNGTDPAGEPADNLTVSFEEWDPGYEIVASWNEDGVGGVRVPVVVTTDDDIKKFEIEVVYQVDPAVAESEIDELEDDDFDPVEIDIDEIGLDS